jgi:hypothetical protein
VFDPTNEVRHLAERFAKGTADIVWITEVSAWEPEPVILGRDGRILRNKAQRAASRTANLSFVYLAGGLDQSDMARLCVEDHQGVARHRQEHGAIQQARPCLR